MAQVSLCHRVSYWHGRGVGPDGPRLSLAPRFILGALGVDVDGINDAAADRPERPARERGQLLALIVVDLLVEALRRSNPWSLAPER